MTLDDVSDRIAIIELASAYENAFDEGDLDKHMATWTDGVSFDSPFGSFSDEAGYLAWLTGFKAQTVANGGTRHLMTNHEIGIEGDTATMTSYLTILNKADRTIISTGVFTDRLRRTEDGWRFVHRTISVDGR